MKLNFQISKANIDVMHKILVALANLWSSGERIYIFFDNDHCIVYPESRGGFDKIYAFARIRTDNAHHVSPPFRAKIPDLHL